MSDQLCHALKKCVFIISLLFALYQCQAQKNDYIWLSGYDSFAEHDTTSLSVGDTLGISVLNFNYTPVNVSYDSLPMNFDETNVSYCDNNGNLLFYSNGIYVANALNQPVVNSEGMNAGFLDEDWDPSIMTDGYRSAQGTIALADISNSESYYLIYSFIDSVPGSGGTNIYNPKILTAYLDMAANGGLGNMVYINKPILTGNFGQPLSATRHGNGKYWWIAVARRNSNCYNMVLLSDTGFYVSPDISCGGVYVTDSDVSSSTFSPDGSKYVQFNISGGVNIYDFDRCTGQLTNPLYYPYPIGLDSVWLGNGVAFSPNSRFLYVSATKYLLQFDMWAADILGSVDTVGVYDGFRHPFGSYFNTAQLGPDGKIYISCGNSEADYHMIGNPDSKGDSCNFQQHALMLPSPSLGVPNFPNYRLGALPGSACDTITGLNEAARAAKEQILKVFPNPATDVTTVDYGFTDWNKGQPNLEVCDALGQIVYSQVLPMYSGFQKIDISSLASGMYTVFIKRNNGVVATQKLVKQ